MPSIIRFSIILTVMACILSLAIPLPISHAQIQWGTLTGRVQDKAGKGLAGALVSVRNNANNIPRSMRTSVDGRYSIPGLQPGTYTITAFKQGFARETVANFKVQLNKINEVEAPVITLRAMTLTSKALGDGSLRAPGVKLAVAVAGDTGKPQQVQSASPVIEGSEVAALVNRHEAARTTNFSEEQVSALPLGGATPMRSFDELGLLVPGIAPPPYTPGVRGPGVGFGIGTAGQFSVNGLRARSNNFSVDGSDNNDPDVGVRRQGFVALVPQSVESIKEISFTTLLWGAELGRNMGSQVNAVSRYGENEFHGQVYGYFSDSRLNARNFFDYTGGASGGENTFTRAQAGLVFQGPIARNRTQFFASFERDIINASSEHHFATPALDERSFLAGDQFTTLLPGSLLISEPMRHATPLGNNILSLYPLPNNAGGPFGANTLTKILPNDGDGSIASFKLTHAFYDNHVLHAHYDFTQDNLALPSVNRAINSTLASKTRSQNLSLLFDSVLSSAVLNQARFTFGRTRLSFLEYPGSPFTLSSRSEEIISLPSAEIALTSQTGPIGQLVIEPFSPVGVDVFTFPQSRTSNTFQYADTLSWSVGGHAIKFGGNVRQYQLNSALDRLYRPVVVFSAGLTSLIEVTSPNIDNPAFQSAGPLSLISGAQMASLGVPSSLLQTITAESPNSRIGLRLSELHFFFNDNWRARQGLSLDYGLRYEYHTVPRSAHRTIERALRLENLPAPGESRFNSAERTAQFNASVAAYNQILDGRSRMYEGDLNNFGPHVGLAWSPGASAKTAIRAGYGIYYDTILGAVISQSRNVFPNEIPINVDPSFLQFNAFSLNNPAFLQIVRDPQGNFTNPVRLLRPGACNQFGTCNQFGGDPGDFVALIGQLFGQNLGGGLAFTLTEKNLRTPYAQHWHLTIERELFKDYLVSAGYVGTKGTRLTRLTTPNLGPNVTAFVPTMNSFGGEALDDPLVFNPLIGSALVTRPNSDLGSFQIYENSASSTYHALQIEARKRYSKNYQFTAAYTWSHAIDYVSDVFPIAGAPIVAEDSRNLSLERADANFDIRQRLAVSFIWDLPFSRNATGLGRALSGWQVASIFQAHTGQPFTLNLPFDANLDGNLSDRPATTEGLIFFDGHGRQRVALAPGRTATDFFTLIVPDINFATGDPTGFTGGGFTQRERIRRNTARGDGFVNLDLALNRRFGFSERRALEFRAELFNVFNRANFGLPIRVIGAPGFGSAVETISPARAVQLALKYSF
jgi:hypothetical protein